MKLLLGLTLAWFYTDYDECPWSAVIQFLALAILEALAFWDDLVWDAICRLPQY